MRASRLDEMLAKADELNAREEQLKADIQPNFFRWFASDLVEACAKYFGLEAEEISTIIDTSGKLAAGMIPPEERETLAAALPSGNTKLLNLGNGSSALVMTARLSDMGLSFNPQVAATIAAARILLQKDGFECVQDVLNALSGVIPSEWARERSKYLIRLWTTYGVRTPLLILEDNFP